MFEEALAHYHFRDIAKARTLLRRCLAACPEDRIARVYAERCARFAKSGVHEGTGEIGMSIAWSPEFRINHALIDAQESFRRQGGKEQSLIASASRSAPTARPDCGGKLPPKGACTIGSQCERRPIVVR